MPVDQNKQENIENAEAKVDGEEGKKPGGLNALFGGMLSGLNDNIGDVEGPAKDNWQFCVFQIRKRKYNILKNGISSKLNIPLGPGDESLIMCLNFSDKELKTLLVDMLKIEPIIYYECMLLSPVDKVYEFDDGSIFYNMVINRENFMDAPLILRMIRKNNFGVVVMNQKEGDKFMLSTEIASKFKFKEIIKPPFPKLFAKRRQKKREELKAKALRDQAKVKPTEDEGDSGKKVIGGVIIQKIRTIMPMNDQEITIDYLLFWISSEGLLRIENFFNLYLLNEVWEIQEQSRELTMEEEDYLHKIDVFENHYIAAQNAKSSKEQYFEKIIESEMASEDFRFLIRHLSSRMLNLSNTTFVIENKLSLSRNTYQMAVDTKMTENSEKLDKLMRQFSLVSIMFLPLTIITGMWGMNCKVPYMMVDEETDNNLDCFYTLCGVMAFIVIFLLTFFKLKGWM